MLTGLRPKRARVYPAEVRLQQVERGHLHREGLHGSDAHSRRDDPSHDRCAGAFLANLSSVNQTGLIYPWLNHGLRLWFVAKLPCAPSYVSTFRNAPTVCDDIGIHRRPY
jgi:hypothetical protein